MSQDGGKIATTRHVSEFIEIERNIDSVGFHTSSTSDISLDSSSESDESWSSAEEEDNKYVAYRQMLTASNQSRKKAAPEPPKKPSKILSLREPQTRSRTRPQRRHRADISKACDTLNRCCRQPPVAPKRIPSSGETLVTELTTSITSLGSAEFQWFASGGQRRGDETKRKEKAMILPQRTKSIEGNTPFHRRGSQRPLK